MITLKDINKTYDMGQASLHVLKGIDLHIDKGEYVSIMGASGSGIYFFLIILSIFSVYKREYYHLKIIIIKNLA